MSYDSHYGDAPTRERRGHDKLGRYLDVLDPLPVTGGTKTDDVAAPRSNKPRRKYYDRDHNSGYYVEEPSLRRRRSEPRTSTHPQDGEHRDSRHKRPRSHSSNQPDWAQVATSAAVAGAVEALRSRHHRENSARTITAAAAAGAADAVIGKDNDKKGARHVAESVIAGLAVDRLAHGRSR